MASKPLVAFAGLLALGGAALVGLGPRWQTVTPVVAPQTLGMELEARLRETATAMHARGDTLASLPALQNSVSTDSDTVRDQTTRERTFRPTKGETITVAQVMTSGSVNVLLVLPSGAKAAEGIDHGGARVSIVDDKLTVGEVFPVMLSEASRTEVKSGALAINWPVDLAPFVEHLDAIGAAARISIDGKDVHAGARILAPNDVLAPIAIAGPLGESLHAVVVVPTIASGPPLRQIGAGIVALGVILLGLGLRGARPLPTQPDAAFAQTLPPTSVTIAVGTQLDNTYEIIRLLGKGGMGTVWQARHMRLPDKRVAIKVLSAEMTNPELLSRFRREAEMTSKLGHPHIVGVMDFNTLPSGVPYIVLEYLEGESLAQRIARGPIMLDETLDLTRQIGSALHAAHKAGIVHRDLKPDNVFLVPAEHNAVSAKVLDFGISKMRGASLTVQTQDATVLGTPQYMSPEQANGRNSEIDARADVWALGTIVYEMLTAEPAFSGESMTVLLVNVLVNPSPSLRNRMDVPIHVAEAIERALAKDANDRWPDMPTFIAALTGQPLSAQRTIVEPT